MCACAHVRVSGPTCACATMLAHVYVYTDLPHVHVPHVRMYTHIHMHTHTQAAHLLGRVGILDHLASDELLLGGRLVENHLVLGLGLLGAYEGAVRGRLR